MLNIGKIGNDPTQQEYYEETVAKSREEYYAGKGEAPGQWVGAGAQQLGVSGQANIDQLRRLFQGQHPDTGETLRKGYGERSIRGFDLTCNAPKSIGVMYEVGNEDMQRKLVESHDCAADQTPPRLRIDTDLQQPTVHMTSTTGPVSRQQL